MLYWKDYNGSVSYTHLDVYKRQFIFRSTDTKKMPAVSNYTVMRNTRIIFLGKIPDHTDDIKSTRDIPSWKRMCFCILKNDHNCRSMGFGLTREQQRMVQSLKQKYGELGEKTGHS